MDDSEVFLDDGPTFWELPERADRVGREIDVLRSCRTPIVFDLGIWLLVGSFETDTDDFRFPEVEGGMFSSCGIVVGRGMYSEVPLEDNVGLGVDLRGLKDI